jgi:hypothetical protein
MALLEHQICWYFEFGLLSLQNYERKKKSVVSKAPRLWYFVITAQMESFTLFEPPHTFPMENASILFYPRCLCALELSTSPWHGDQDKESLRFPPFPPFPPFHSSLS